ncbi:kanadaptin isoform 3-T3 [Odontesthes bonariensis]|uniref:kanadaptin isoform X3 n=1 Tax=Odontesthes bonariensis TaxID=219752 RepID=UPI003F583056
MNMAASPPTDASVKNTAEEINSTVKSDDCSATKNGGEQTEKELHKTETEEPFKKPALFSAPSVNKRSNAAAPSKPSSAEIRSVNDDNKSNVAETTSDASSGAASEGKSPEKGQEDDENGERDKNEAPVKPKPKGPEFDEEEESDLTVTELRERARKQKAELEKKMMGDYSDEEEGEEEEGGDSKDRKKVSKDDSVCTWGMDEDAAPEEDENEENPFSTEFREDQEAAYLKDPKKALQGFYDREGEELEFEYEDKSHGSWLCRIKLPVDDALGRQLVAEVTHTGKKKEAAIQCCLEACRMLEARGLLRQEAVSRKRKKKNWEDEDYYDSDDDTFLDRTGTVERKRQERMKKAGKIEERPETYESLVAKLSAVEKELAETQKKLNAGKRDSSGSSAEDSLDAFMTAVKSEEAMDAVERRKLHVHMADLRKDAQKLRKLVELTRPAQMPSLQPGGSSEAGKPKKTLPLFGAMKGGSKFKLKTGTIGKLPPKRPNLPAGLFNMKELPPSGEQEEEEEEEVDAAEKGEGDGDERGIAESNPESEDSVASTSKEAAALGRLKDESEESKAQSHKPRRSDEAVQQLPLRSSKSAAPRSPESTAEGEKEPPADPSPKKKKVMGPSRPPVQLPGQYPEDDPDYSVWLPPAGQTGDGRTHLNEKYGY